MLFTLVAKHLTQIEVNLFCSEPEAKSQPGEVTEISNRAGGAGGAEVTLVCSDLNVIV